MNTGVIDEHRRRGGGARGDEIGPLQVKKTVRKNAIKLEMVHSP
jgi:hypothetical protein